MSLMGIDIGTTGCKAVAFDESGKLIAYAYREYPLHAPNPGWAELDSKQVWNDTKDCIREVSKKTKRDPIQALAVSCQGEAVTAIGANDEFLSNSIVSFDPRTGPYVEQWIERFGRDTLFQATGQPPASIFTALKLNWYRDNQPEVLDNAKYILGYEDLINYFLTGEAVVDFSLAGRTMLFDIVKEEWRDDFLGAVGLTKDVMPKAVPSGTLVGTVIDSIADEIGLPRGVKVVTGGHDQPCQMLGAGVTDAKTAAYGIGTVACIGAAFDKALLNEQMLASNLCCYHHTCPDLYCVLVYNYTGAVLFRWYRDQFAREEMQRAKKQKRDVYEILTEEAADKPTNLLVLPHFTTTGVPHFDNKSKGAILGLTLDTTKAEITRALLEGVTYELRQGMELLAQAGGKVEAYRATGGGAKSPYWLQIKADIMGAPVAAPQVAEAGCLGAAVLAGAASGVYDSIPEAAKAVAKVEHTYEPNPENKKLYDERFEWFKEIYPKNKELFGKM
ncbi:MAG: FGGY family carbohydrate kinase [Candidatus Hinthialibacter antarcticus]|nr:FGGY family carbohydrate kinase [Candidatus Hinthialibacter antarcticus]